MNEPPDHLEGALNRPGTGGKWGENTKKILNRGNEAKDLLKRQDLAFSGAQNELFLECKKPRSKWESRFQVPGFKCQLLGLGARGWGRKGRCQKNRCQESEVRSEDEEHLPSAGCLLLTADCLLHLRGVRVGGTLGLYRSLRHDVTAGRERKN
jgi:hypothetical protein